MKTLTLQKYIEEVGVYELASKMGCRTQNINQWKLLLNCPRPRYAAKLLKVSKGRLTLEGIYGPFIKKNKNKWK